MDKYEDPLHNTKREKNRQQEISRRTRIHARTLQARVFLAQSGLLLVRGTPDPEQLREPLNQPSLLKTLSQATG